MIVSFEIEQAEDLELLLRLAKRLNIKRVDNNNSTTLGLSTNLQLKTGYETTEINAINEDIASIFGAEPNDTPPLPFGL